MSTKARLFDLFRSERDDPFPERWKFILSRLAPLTGVDESTTCLGHGSQTRHEVTATEITQHYRHQPVAGPGEQGEGRGGSSADTIETVVRGDVGPLRKTTNSRQRIAERDG